MSEDVKGTQVEVDRELLVRLDERTRRLVDDMATVKHVLIEGNGVPPLTVQVATLSTKVRDIEKAAEGKGKTRAQWTGIVVSAVLGILSLAVALYTVL